MEHLLFGESRAPSESIPAKIDFEKQALKHARAKNVKKSKCMPAYFVVPTANICEHLFLFARYTLNDRWKELLSANLKILFFFT